MREEWNMRERFGSCLSILAAFLAFFTTWPAAGADSELTISNTAMRKMLMDQLYTDHGKYHLLRGSRCQFAYLDSPAVNISRGRVSLRTHLTGLLGVEGTNGCVGSPESMDLTVSGRPYFSGEYIGLTDIRVDQVSNELYRIVLQNFLDLALPRALEINLRQGLEQLISDQRSSYEVTVSRLVVTNLTAEDNRIHANVSFALSAR